MSLPRLRLAKNEDKRLRAGHLWIYSNEIDTQATPLKTLQPGQHVLIENAQEKVLGTAYVNPHSLICARLLTRDETPFDRSMLVHRLNIALGMRQAFFREPYYRLVYGESDLLPGLVVDRFGDHLSVQLNTAGMEAMREDIIAALVKVLKPASIVFRNDSSMRQLEGLPVVTENVYGEPPEVVQLIENGVKFLAPMIAGQKTGWFYDMRPNRAWLRDLVPGKRVLDVFSYVGSFGISAGAFGASEVWCVDASELALDFAEQNAELNGLADRFTAVQGDAFEVLKALKEDDQRFDVIIVDPPAFIKKKKDHAEGLKAYRRINEMAMRLLHKDGFLLSGSCSMHLPREDLLEVVRASARHLDRHAQILAEGMQGVDHPVHPAIPETRYLKAVLSRIVLT